MNNKFFTYRDSKLNKLIFDLEPNFFWSRLFEYTFALSFADKNDVVCDMACGVEHPFKFELTKLCKTVHACDLEDLSYNNVIKGIKNRYNATEKQIEYIDMLYPLLNVKQCGIDNTGYENEKFDKIFCISVFEHLDDITQEDTLREFYRVLKKGGKAILTCDYPTINPYELIKNVESMGFVLDGKYDYTIYDDHIQSDYFGYNCKCFSMVLVK